MHVPVTVYPIKSGKYDSCPFIKHVPFRGIGQLNFIIFFLLIYHTGRRRRRAPSLSLTLVRVAYRPFRINHRLPRCLRDLLLLTARDIYSAA